MISSLSLLSLTSHFIEALLSRRTLGPSQPLVLPMTPIQRVFVNSKPFSKTRSRQGLSEQSKTLLEIGGRLGITSQSLEEWYKVSQRDLLRFGGIKLSSKYRYGIADLVIATFPEHNWDRSRFVRFPQKLLWAQQANVNALMVYFGELLGIREGDYVSWYKVSIKSLEQLGAGSLIRHFGGYKLDLLRNGFPEHTWDVLKFGVKPRQHWKSPLNHKEAVLLAGKRLGIKEGDYEAWYKVGQSDLLRYGLMSPISKTSRFQFFSSVFPEFEWKPWLFVNARMKRGADSIKEDELSALQSEKAS